jgi:hypothetical protein
MPIEFNCPGCQKKLRVADSGAGKQAKCPQCGAVASVPAPSGVSDQAQPTPPEGSPFGAPTPPRVEKPVNPYASPTTGPSYPTTTGTTGGPISHRPLDVGEVIDYAWRVWRDNLGLLVGAFVVITVINMAVSVPFSLLQSSLENQGEMEAALGVGLIGNIIGNVVSIFLGIGFAQLCLRLARGERAEFAQIFGGGPRFLPVLGVSILLGIAIFVGAMACIVPGILLALMLWPAYYLVVDDKAGVIESFSVASNLTKNNWGAAFLLWLVSFAISLLGLMALCIGIIFAAPLVAMMWVTAYLMMSGQLARTAPA